MASDSRFLPVRRAAVWRLVTDLASDDFPSRRDLLLQALLHLPRIARADGTVEVSAARAEVSRIVAWRSAELEPLREYAKPPSQPPRLDQLLITRIDDDMAAPVVSHFHYLRSARPGSATVAALYDGRIAAICCISELDLPRIEQHLPVSGLEAVVVSRVFAFDWAARNTISYLLARAERHIIDERAGTRMLLTYLNPNLGFTGSSYRAANWVAFGRETGTRYAYWDQRYVTDRYLPRLSPAKLAEVEYSEMPLQALLLLCRLLDKDLQRRYPDGFQVVVPRSAPSVGSPVQR